MPGSGIWKKLASSQKTSYKYLAHDEQLGRLGAIRLPHAHLLTQAADAQAYLSGAAGAHLARIDKDLIFAPARRGRRWYING